MKAMKAMKKAMKAKREVKVYVQLGPVPRALRGEGEVGGGLEEGGGGEGEVQAQVRAPPREGASDPEEARPAPKAMEAMK